MQNRVQRALARRERMRRSRDQAWMVFAGLASAGLFGWIMLVVQFASSLGVRWWAVAIYGAIAVLSTLLAIRAFGAARRLSRRMEDSEPLAADERDDRRISVWDEILRGERR